jgi:hypothetical protein
LPHGLRSLKRAELRCMVKYQHMPEGTGLVGAFNSQALITQSPDWPTCRAGCQYLHHTTHNKGRCGSCITTSSLHLVPNSPTEKDPQPNTRQKVRQPSHKHLLTVALPNSSAQNSQPSQYVSTLNGEYTLYECSSGPVAILLRPHVPAISCKMPVFKMQPQHQARLLVHHAVAGPNVSCLTSWKVPDCTPEHASRSGTCMSACACPPAQQRFS